MSTLWKTTASVALCLGLAGDGHAQPSSAASAPNTANAAAGDKRIAEVKVDVAPGAVSAAGMLSLAGDKVVNVHEPRDLTVALKAADGENVFGLSITPARTSLMPMNASTYAASWPQRLLGAVTLGYAQTTVPVSGKDYRQRAVSGETSLYLHELDDPLIRYWRRLERAQKDDVKDDCLVMRLAAPAPAASAASAAMVGLPMATPTTTTATAPAAAASGPKVPDADVAGKAAQDAQAAKCREDVAKGAKWYASRFWISFAAGRYGPAEGGGSERSLGRTAVVGLKLGGEVAKGHEAALTIAMKRTSGEPVLTTYAAAVPTRKDVRLSTFRGAYGTNTARLTIEGSRFRSDVPTASERTFKRAIGLDLRLMEGAWLTVRAGKQRKVDNSGDETGVSLNLDISPGAKLTL
jgi:hypothetical protein